MELEALEAIYMEDFRRACGAGRGAPAGQEGRGSPRCPLHSAGGGSTSQV